MSDQHERRFDRRQLFRYGGGLAALAAGGAIVSRWKGGVLNPLQVTTAGANVIPVPPADHDLFIGGTDGWISLPVSAPIVSPAGVQFHPDTYAPADTAPGLTTYIFGFRNITALTNGQQSDQKNHAQHNAPIFWLEQYDDSYDAVRTTAGAAAVGAATLPVASTAGFPAKGRVYVGVGASQQLVAYTGRTATSFTGCSGIAAAVAAGARVVVDGDFKVSITNLGLAQRPDLFDAHTLHWHGFRNVIPFFDGEPTGSVSVPAGSLFTYVYRPRDPGTYMYHCHVEDVEHVHMGMTGLVWVHARQDATGNAAGAPVARNAGGAASAPKGYAYNDGVALGDPRSTAYDREYAMFLSEVWAEAHWADAHIQLPEWSDYHPDFALLNGRVYPETVAPNAPLAANWNTSYDWKGRAPYYLPVDVDSGGDLVPPPGHDNLRYQPLSSLVECNAGDRVLLRFANLGFKEAAMTLTGIKMRVVGRDATPMRGVGADGVTRNGADTSYLTNTLNIGPGESYDAIFVAPPYTGNGTDPQTYVLYNRNFTRSDTGTSSLGGQATEIRVYPAGSRPAQLLPNH